MLLAGAALGALLVLRAGPAWALAAAALLIAVVLVVAVVSSRAPQDWHAPR
jgi:predicted MFS family arabinose efflux permease